MLVIEWWQPTAARSPQPKRWYEWVVMTASCGGGQWVEFAIIGGV